MNAQDMSMMMEMLSKMDKKDLEKGLSQVSKILQSKDADKIITEIRKKQNPS